MINVTVGTNLKRVSDVYSSNTTLRTILESNEVEYHGTQVYLDAVPIFNDELDMTLEEKGITEKCRLTTIVKADGGVR